MSFFENFEGFNAPDKHTQLPNELIEMILQSGVRFDPRNPDKPILSIGEIKILLFMFRETFGWQAHGRSLQFSFKELMIATYLGRASINNALKDLIEKKFIQRKEINGSMHYRLNLKEYNDMPWELTRDWKKTFKLEEKKKKRFVNRTRSSSVNEPEAVRLTNQKQFVNRTTKNNKDLDFTKDKPSLNKGLNKGLNKDLNKDLSIYTQLNQYKELSPFIKKILIKNENRLMDDKINIKDIISTYYSFKEILNHDNFDLYFADVLRRVLEKTKNKIGNIQDIINTTINNDYKIFTSPSKSFKGIYKNSQPNWLKNITHKTFEKENQLVQANTDDITEEKHKFEALISKFKE